MDNNNVFFMDDTQDILSILHLHKALGASPMQPASFLEKVAGKTKNGKVEILKLLKDLFRPEDYTELEQEILKAED
jgi:hypothetical protein